VWKPIVPARVVGHRVDVRVGEVGPSQRDQVPEGAQVGLERGGRPAGAQDLELERRGGARGERPVGEPHGVAVDLRRRARGRQWDGAGLAGRGDGHAEGIARAPGGEVRDRPVAAGRRQRDREGEAAPGPQHRMQMLVAREVVAHDDQVHQLRLLAVEPGHRLAAGVHHADRPYRRSPGGHGRPRKLQRHSSGRGARAVSARRDRRHPLAPRADRHGHGDGDLLPTPPRDEIAPVGPLHAELEAHPIATGGQFAGPGAVAHAAHPHHLGVHAHPRPAQGPTAAGHPQHVPSLVHVHRPLEGEGVGGGASRAPPLRL
jgi:hypothetical protein